MNPLATVVIPVRDEEKHLVECLRAIASQDVGAEALQVVVADGRSADRTAVIARQEAARLGFGQFDLVDNPATGIAAGLNRALAHASAPIVVRADARSRLASGHVRRALAVLAERSDVGVVGGGQRPSASASGVAPQAIERALSNRATTGFARYRWADAAGPADTVWLGAFRRDELRALGGWNERLAANEDYELCERYRAAGSTVWFDPGLTAEYRPRTTLRAVGRQYLRYGMAKGSRWRGGAAISPRHVGALAIPLVVAPGALVLARRRPWVAVVASAAGLLAVDAAADPCRRDPFSVRAAAPAVTVLTCTAWSLGVVLGALGISKP